ncbi:MAG: Mce-associated rane protein [Pseudonocardiales bacterium]|jgi:Mce-associated membrane protein|nr:Mce-associated rane protein [Pseudonocardiales bacterium]
MSEEKNEIESRAAEPATPEGAVAVLDPEPATGAGDVGGAEPPVASEARAAAGPRRFGPIATMLTVLLVVLLAVGALLGVRAVQAGDRQADRAAVVSQAEQAAGDLTTISAGNAQSRINALLDLATGPFRDQLVGYSSMFQAVLQQGGVGSNGSVTASGVEKLDSNTAVVLVSVTATVTNSQVPDGVHRSYRIAVSLTRVGSSWLVSSMDFVG